MLRKKILICLSASDDALLENSFIEQNLRHPHNLIVKFHLESIQSNRVLVEAGTGSAVAPSNMNGQSNHFTQLTNGHGDVHTLGGAGSKRQMIYSNSIKELLSECQFADLLIIRKSNYDSQCTHYGQKKNLREVLSKTDCPVLVVPDDHSKVEQILLVYDGSHNALNAIKLLRITMAPLGRELPVTVIIPCSKNNGLSSTQEKMLIEYLRLHFKDLGIHKVCEESVHTLQFAIYPDKNPLMVVNDPDHALPDFLDQELKLFESSSKSKPFRFLVNPEC